MYCVACNLHYPDHLGFCRRCGQALARSSGAAPVELTCCTRCGARAMGGEKFCEQCGFRFGVVAPELVIGACYHCGTSWRTGWRFCKNCGLDRDRALLRATSTPFAASAPTKKSELLNELPEVVIIRCEHCGTEAMPYSRFCEACGRSVNKTDATILPVKPASVSAQVQIETPVSDQHPANPDKPLQPAPPPALSLPAAFVSSAPPPLIDEPNTIPPPPAIAPLGATLSNPVEEKRVFSGVASAAVTTNDEARLVIERHPPMSSEDKPRASNGLPANYTPADNLPISRRPVIRRPAPEVLTADLIVAPEMQNKAWRAAGPMIALAALLIFLLGAAVVWWLWPNAVREASSASITPLPQASPARPALQTSPASTSQMLPSAATAADMIFIPGGQFMMGRKGGDEFESPARSVTVRPFYIDRTEVTNEEYQKFVVATRRRAPAHWLAGKFPADEVKFPVVNVTWNDARAYAKWAKKRLPSEAEWEFAARGAAGRAYPWGNDWRQGLANADQAQGGQIKEVGQYPRGVTPQGLLDICGNVWEWTASDLVSYADGKKKLARGKVIRGGAFDGPRERVTTTYRGVLPADAARDKTGFRCARDAQ